MAWLGIEPMTTSSAVHVIDQLSERSTKKKYFGRNQLLAKRAGKKIEIKIFHSLQKTWAPLLIRISHHGTLSPIGGKSQN